MKSMKQIRIIILVLTVAFNILFLNLCGFGKDLQPHTADYLDPIFAVITVVVLAVGESSVIWQFYLRDRFRNLQRRMFDFKLWRQCIAILLYYGISIALVSQIVYSYSVFYVAVFALILCPFWVGGSRILWMGEEAYYLNDLGRLYKVSKVMENDEVVEMLCQRPGDRERTITIAKKKQKLDQYSE